MESKIPTIKTEIILVIIGLSLLILLAGIKTDIGRLNKKIINQIEMIDKLNKDNVELNELIKKFKGSVYYEFKEIKEKYIGKK